MTNPTKWFDEVKNTVTMSFACIELDEGLKSTIVTLSLTKGNIDVKDLNLKSEN